ncbi:hypothetical protein [Klebsiella pneumoniae]|uniref:hypothetical protein n=1 Tax=Klebsiella pneumoniae TaxID=573 RepID=UPI002B1BE048|nr:hypothetical protein [Klebsiella pneumoniae]
MANIVAVLPICAVEQHGPHLLVRCLLPLMPALLSELQNYCLPIYHAGVGHFACR